MIDLVGLAFVVLVGCLPSHWSGMQSLSKRRRRSPETPRRALGYNLTCLLVQLYLFNSRAIEYLCPSCSNLVSLLLAWKRPTKSDESLMLCSLDPIGKLKDSVTSVLMST